MLLPKFPTTRFQGSKRKILLEISNLVQNENAKSVIDLYSGSGIVSLLLRHLGKTVLANDYLIYNQNTASLFLTYREEDLDLYQAEIDLDYLLLSYKSDRENIVSNEFNGIYFKDEENLQIDNFCHNIKEYDGIKRSLYIYAVGQALIKKRPYNLFHRANLEMRLKDVKRSFGNAKTWETSIKEHAIKCIKELYSLPIKPNLENKATCIDTRNLENLPQNYDLIYMDPPYINAKGVAVNYSNFYHFLEGLCDYSLFKGGDANYPHKPIVNLSSAWHKKESAIDQIRSTCKHFKNSTIVMSYRSDGTPTATEILLTMEECGRKTEIHSAGEYKYALSKNDENEELFIIARK